MRTVLLAILLCFTHIIVFSQDNALNSLTSKAIELHDEQKYDEAIELYKKALIINPNSALVNYEIAITYSALNDYDNVIKHCSIVIEKIDTINNPNDKQILLLTYNTLGSVLDDMGKVEESIVVFERAIADFGYNYLVCYNLGLNYYKLNDYNKVIDILTRGINSNPNHPSSHMLLGYAMRDLGKISQMALCFYFFLFLEPATERGHDIFEKLLEETSKNVKPNIDSTKIEIVLNNNLDSDFDITDFNLAISEALKYSGENKTEFESFYDKTNQFFSVVKSFSDNNIWSEFYIPFFKDISNSDYLETFCRYISGVYWDESYKWIEANSQKLDKFGKWINGEEDK